LKAESASPHLAAEIESDLLALQLNKLQPSEEVILPHRFYPLSMARVDPDFDDHRGDSVQPI
jgi:hypothetical protein